MIETNLCSCSNLMVSQIPEKDLGSGVMINPANKSLPACIGDEKEIVPLPTPSPALAHAIQWEKPGAFLGRREG